MYSESSVAYPENDWTIEQYSLRVRCCRNHFGQHSISVHWEEKLVFEASGDSDNSERKITAYIPGNEWQTALYLLYRPIEEKNEAKQQEEEAKLRARFGL